MRKRAVRIQKRAVLPGKWSSRRQKPFALILAGALVLAGLIGIDAAAGIATAGPTQTDVPAPRPGWTEVFSDSFNGPAGFGLDSADWLYDVGTGYPGGATNWGTNEVETATDSTSNVHLDGNGHLVITPLRDSSGHWTSGRVETRRTDFAAPPGGALEFSASLQQPNPANGLGYWPAFWALGAAARPAAANNWPSIGELDMMEDVNGLSQHSSTFHCGVDPGGPCSETNGIGSGLQACSGCQVGYHTYSVIVDRTNTSDEQLRFYLDGTQTYSLDQHQVDTATWQAAVDHGFFAIFNLAIGGSYPDKVCGCTSPSPATTSGASMNVDWFAVYEKSSVPGRATVR
jgi:beta-glucanase (GH16 family)